MLKAGLTGGIGSGKTTVSRVFEVLGIPVYNADREAKMLMDNDNEIVSKLKNTFGNDIYTRGKLNRKCLSDIVFNDTNKLRTLNTIVHPVVIQHFLGWAETQTAPYVVKEAALLFEAGTYADCDVVITVSAQVSLRVKRVIDRDKVAEEEVLARMRNQWPEEEKIKRSNYVINNDDKTLLTPQILKIHEALIFRSKAG